MMAWNLDAQLASAKFLHALHEHVEPISENFSWVIGVNLAGFSIHAGFYSSCIGNNLWTSYRTCPSATKTASDNLAKAHQRYKSNSNEIKASES